MFDANTIVSAALSPDGKPRRALLTARSLGFVALSNAVFAEIDEVLSRPKFARVLAEHRRREILELLTAAAVWKESSERLNVCRDARDNMYLELAAAAGAQTIVSGDQDLLILSPWRGIRILSAADFLASFHRPAAEPSG